MASQGGGQISSHIIYMKRVPKDVDLGKDFQSNTVITPILASNRPENLQGASSSILLAGTKI